MSRGRDQIVREEKQDPPSRPAAGDLEENLGGHLGRAAAASDEFDRLVQIGLALGDALGERERVTSLHEHVQAPAFDLAALVVFSLEDRQLVHPGEDSA
jgi:hypothetical protein